MPLLQLRLTKTYDGAVNDTKNTITLTGGLTKQPLILKFYQIALYSYNDEFETYAPKPLEYLSLSSIFVQLPFLNNYDVNTNFSIENAVMIPVSSNSTKPETVDGITNYYGSCENHGQMDILFNPAKNIDSMFSNWEIYDIEGKIVKLSSDQRIDIILMFEYRRPDLI